MEKKILYLFIFVVLCLGYSFSVMALGLSGKQIPPIQYKPGTSFTASYEIESADLNVVAEVGGDGVFKHFSTTPIINGKFDIVLDFPADEYVPPGEYVIAVTVREGSIIDENGNEIGGIGARTSVSKKLHILVYAYDKDVTASLDVPNVNNGSKVNVNLGVASVSYKNIDVVNADIILFDEETKMELMRKTTAKKALKSLESVSFKEFFDTEKFEAKKYFVKSVITYDGIIEEVNSTFFIGNMDLVLKDYTPEIKQGYGDFSVKVTNNWGNVLNNVKAKLLLDGKEIIETPTISLQPWQEGELKAIVKIDLNPGIYKGELHLFYEGEIKKVPIEVKVIESQDVVLTPDSSTSSFSSSSPNVGEESYNWIFISVAIFAIVIGVLIYLKKHQEGSKDEF